MFVRENFKVYVSFFGSSIEWVEKEIIASKTFVFVFPPVRFLQLLGVT